MSLAEAKAHMRVDFAEDDAQIMGFVKAAREELEHELARPVAMQSVRFTALPPVESSFEVPNATNITAVRTRNGAAVSVVIGWSFEPVQRMLTLPAATVAAGLPVEIDADVGMAHVPAALATWIKMRAATLYEQRETHATGVGVDELQFARHLYDRWIDWSAK